MKGVFMQVLKVGVFLVSGMAAAACGGGSDGDGGGDDDDSGGSSSSGGSSNGGSSSGKGGSSSGSSNGGSSNGGSSSGGTTGNGGSTGVGGTSGGDVCLFDVPECEDFFSCVFNATCAQAGAQQAACIAQFKEIFSTTACYPAGTDLATACNMVKQDPEFTQTYPQCVN